MLPPQGRASCQLTNLPPQGRADCHARHTYTGVSDDGLARVLHQLADSHARLLEKVSESECKATECKATEYTMDVDSGDESTSSEDVDMEELMADAESNADAESPKTDFWEFIARYIDDPVKAVESGEMPSIRKKITIVEDPDETRAQFFVK